MKLTKPQRRALEAVQRLQPARPKEVAWALWPDSPAWKQRTRKYGTNDPGALGGTMPMKAGTLLWRLRRMGLVRADYGDRWSYALTEKGREILDNDTKTD